MSAGVLARAGRCEGSKGAGGFRDDLFVTRIGQGVQQEMYRNMAFLLVQTIFTRCAPRRIDTLLSFLDRRLPASMLWLLVALYLVVVEIYTVPEGCGPRQTTAPLRHFFRFLPPIFHV